mmetsp:Transcript_11848/g.9546  ORF Transcript_11848/g.9546 Transcript_11848/m.9546 type:complete len:127 (+) Transcript_11848:207-587(+)
MKSHSAVVCMRQWSHSSRRFRKALRNLTIRSSIVLLVRWIRQIAVCERARGKGVGKKLMIWTEDKARECGCQRIVLEVISRNSHAQGVYEKGGYVNVSRCFKQCLMSPMLYCLMRVPYVYTMVKQL